MRCVCGCDGNRLTVSSAVGLPGYGKNQSRLFWSLKTRKKMSQRDIYADRLCQKTKLRLFVFLTLVLGI